MRDHPGLAGLGRTDREQRLAERFAEDLFAWLVGGPEVALGPLARVVVQVAADELAPVRLICAQRPTLAVQAAARAAAVLWLAMQEEEGARPLEEEPSEEPAEEPSEEPSEEPAEEPVQEQPAPELTSDDRESESSELVQAALRWSEGEECGTAIAAAVREAEIGTTEAMELVGALGQLIPGAGWSLAPGEIRRGLIADLPRLARLAAEVDKVRELADALGRAEAEEARSGLGEGGSQEVVGVAPSGDVARALPVELALLGDPETEDLFYARWAEHRLISLELAGPGIGGRSEQDRGGAVIACLDASASMHGPPEWMAKALLVAVCRRLARRGREVTVLVFGGRGQRIERRLRPGRASLDGLLDLLAMSFDGGTDFDGPLLRALELLETPPYRRADILVLTDGQAAATPEVVGRVERARQQHGVRVVTAILGQRFTLGVEPFSDEVVAVRGEQIAGLGVVCRSLERTS